MYSLWVWIIQIMIFNILLSSPHGWIEFTWNPLSSLERWLAVLGIVFVFLLTELNTFYLKFVLSFPPGLLKFKTLLSKPSPCLNRHQIFFIHNGIRWPLFSYLHRNSQSFNYYLCALDTTLRILNT